jgi:alpha-amylase
LRASTTAPDERSSDGVKATLILCIHNHQPVGNLPGVFEFACRDAYLPFLDAIERFPGIKLALHNTGPLLEWYEKHEPSYIERLRALVDRGQVEILTGAFYEPILCGIPERDAAGQIAKMSDYIESTFGVTPRGMWLAERVWEPRLAKTIAEAGVDYVPLDDYEFRLAGIEDEDLTGYYVTEEQGVPLRIFPISKHLRYAIPFREPEETVAHLRGLAERGTGLMALFGDDGEKFGVWPGTHSHVYMGGWLERFFGTLEENSDWLTTSTFAEYVDREPPRGRAHLPTASYPEMMEWALPTPARQSYEGMLARLEKEGTLPEWGPFLSGGIWKGFQAKYDESNVMARKMYRVSDKVASQQRANDLLRGAESHPSIRTAGGREDDPVVDVGLVARARNELWKGQCNCAYWHGVFGGLYLPHLRSAIYRHLIRAENLLDSFRGETWDAVEVVDHDLDGNAEIVLESHWANVFIAPARGGTIFELDSREAEVNFLATMSRYDEAYHHSVAEDCGDEDCDVRTIHGAARAKEDGLEALAGVDSVPRRSAVDRFYAPGTTAAEVAGGTVADVGTFADGRCEFELRRDGSAVGVVLRQDGSLSAANGRARLSVEKHVWLLPDGAVRVDYELAAGDDANIVFAPEWNLAFLTASTDYLRLSHEGYRRKDAGKLWEFPESRGIAFLDRLSGRALRFTFEPAGGLWTWPLETASQSEGGLERVFQGVTVVANWPVVLTAGSRASCSMTLAVEPLEEEE